MQQSMTSFQSSTVCCRGVISILLYSLCEVQLSNAHIYRASLVSDQPSYQEKLSLNQD